MHSGAHGQMSHGPWRIRGTRYSSRVSTAERPASDAGSGRWRYAGGLLLELRRRTGVYSSGAGVHALHNSEGLYIGGKYHHLDNLYIMDGSLFPTSIGANPQLSIYGLVYKLSTNLLDHFKA